MVAWQQLIIPNRILYASHPLDVVVAKNFSISTDSRQISPQQVFVALPGKKYDGFDFLPMVLAAGCPMVIYQYQPDRQRAVGQYQAQYPACIFLGVDESLTYLQQVAKNHLAWWRNSDSSSKGHKTIITLTGSNGKTTCKEMLAHLATAVLSPEQICATAGNFNNHLGLPLTLCRLTSQHQLAILEIGTNHPGEISLLCSLIGPTSGMITNIGQSHLEFFQNREGVYWEKRSLFDAIAGSSSQWPSPIFLINGDDDYLAQLPKLPFTRTIGTAMTNDYPIRLQFNQLTILHSLIIANPHLIGEHNFANLAMAWVLIWELIAHCQETYLPSMLALASNFLPKDNRSKLVANSQGGFSFIDAYNANPSSMEKSLTAFVSWLRAHHIPWSEVLLVVGDMNELGTNSAQLHQQLGAQLSTWGAQNVIFVGRYASDWALHFTGDAHCFGRLEELLPLWPQLRQSYKHFFFKASRSLQLESITGIN